MRGVHIFEKPCYREIRVMRGRAMRGPPVLKVDFLSKARRGAVFQLKRQVFFPTLLHVRWGTDM